MSRQLRSPPPGWRFESVPEQRLAQFEADLRRLVAAIRSIGARPALATHANAFQSGEHIDHRRLTQWGYFYPRASGATILRFDAAAADLTSRVAFDLGVPIADVPESMGAPTDKLIAFAHFTDEGARLAADAMACVVIGFLKDGIV